MLKLIINSFNSMEEHIKKIMKYGIRFAVLICFFALAILITYTFNLSPDLYYIGLSVFKLGLFFIVEFIICALAINTIKKQTG